MPVITLTTLDRPLPAPVFDPRGMRITIPRPRFHCLVQLPGSLLPQDGIIDTGAPLTCLPERLWSGLAEGRDFEWLPFAPGTPPPTGVMPNWTYTFRVARFLMPVALMDYVTAIDRPDVIAAFATGNPPQQSRALPPIIIGLWGGLLEGGKIAVSRTATGQVEGALEFP